MVVAAGDDRWHRKTTRGLGCTHPATYPEAAWLPLLSFSLSLSSFLVELGSLVVVVAVLLLS
jgi:hypothetical protein